MRIAIICNRDFPMWHFRRELVAKLLQMGHKVTIYAPDDDRTGIECVKNFRQMGAEYVICPIFCFISPLKDINVFEQLYYQLRKNKPDIVFTMSVKPNTFGTLVARLAGIRHIVGLVCGAGYGFEMGGTLKQKLIRACVQILYRWGGKCMDRHWFLNHDDRDLFIKKRIATPKQAVVIVSEGINLADYSMENIALETIIKIRKEFDANNETVVIGCCPGRNTYSKGVKEFVDVAKAAETWNMNVRFVLVGSLDPNAPDNVPEKYYNNIPLLKCFPFRQDIAAVVASVDILTLPSYYREGVPRILLEGLAMKKPIITTDNVGCREVADNEINGFIVPPRNSNALANAIKKMVIDKDIRTRYSEASFQKTKKEFDIHKINARVISEVLGLKME